MQLKYILTIGLSLCAISAFAQHSNEFYNKGADITIQAGAEVHVLGDVYQDGGNIANNGLIKLDGHWYNDNAASTQSGTGLAKFQNDKTNLTEDQQIRGVANLTGANAFYDVDLNNTGTNKLVFLNGVDAEMKNTLEFVDASERFRTQAAVNTDQGSTFTNYVHLSNTANTALVGASGGGAVVKYIEGRLRWSMANGVTYTLPVGFGASAVDAVAYGAQIASITHSGTGVVEAGFSREAGDVGGTVTGDNECDYKTARYANHGFWAISQASGSTSSFNLTVTPSNAIAAPFSPSTPCSYTLGWGTATAGNGTQDVCTTSFGATNRTSLTSFGNFRILSTKLYDPKSLDKTICFGASTQLDAYDPASVGSDPDTHSSPYTYAWSSSLGSSEISSAVSTPNNSTTTYTVTVTGENGCTSSTTARVIIQDNPVASVTGTNTICEGASTTLTASSGDTYLWDNSAGSAVSATVSPAANTTYAVTVTQTNGCTRTANRAVNVNANPVASVTGTNTICEGNSTTLTASAGNTYAWDNGAGAAVSATVSPTANTTYNVTVAQTNGCTRVASRAVSVNANPVASVTGTNTICEGSSTTLTASAGNTYTWNNGAGAAVSATVSPTANTTYNVTVAQTNGCTRVASRAVSVNPTPVLSIVTGCPSGGGGTLSASATGGTTPYTFSAPTSQSNLMNGNYTMIVTDNNNCSHQLSATISCVILPVKLIVFDGKVDGATNYLYWQTATEINSSAFIVERSHDGVNEWTAIGSRRAAGNTQNVQNYNLTDEKPFPHTFYRLRMLDIDGSFEYSNTVLLEHKKGGNSIVAAYPVPVTNEVRIDYEINDAAEVRFDVVDELGRYLQTQKVAADKGLNTISFDLSNLPVAVYSILMTNGSYRHTIKVVKI